MSAICSVTIAWVLAGCGSVTSSEPLPTRTPTPTATTSGAPAESAAPTPEPAVGFYVAVLPPLPFYATEAFGGPGRFAVEGMRVEVVGEDVRISEHVFETAIDHAAKSGEGWLFILADGLLLRSDTFLGEARPEGHLRALRPIRRWPTGLAYVSADMQLLLADGSGPFRPIAIPGDAALVSATVLRDGRGWARTIEGDFLGTRDGGLTWSPRTSAIANLVDRSWGDPSSAAIRRVDRELADMMAVLEPPRDEAPNERLADEILRGGPVTQSRLPVADGYPRQRDGWSTAPDVVAGRVGLAALLSQRPVLLDSAAYTGAVPLGGGGWVLRPSLGRERRWNVSTHNLFGGERFPALLRAGHPVSPLQVPSGCRDIALTGWSLFVQCGSRRRGYNMIADVRGFWPLLRDVRLPTEPLAGSAGGGSALIRGPHDPDLPRSRPPRMYVERGSSEAHTGLPPAGFDIQPELTVRYAVAANHRGNAFAWLDAETGEVVQQQQVPFEPAQRARHEHSILADGSVLACFRVRGAPTRCAGLRPNQPPHELVLPVGATEVAFLDLDFGIVRGPGVWATIDGGETWTPIELPNNAETAQPHCHSQACFAGNLAVTRDPELLPEMSWVSFSRADPIRPTVTSLACEGRTATPTTSVGPTAWGSLFDVRAEPQGGGSFRVQWWLPDGHSASASGRVRLPREGERSSWDSFPRQASYLDYAQQPQSFTAVGASTHLLLAQASWNGRGFSGSSLFLFREGGRARHLPNLSVKLALALPNGGLALLARRGERSLWRLIVIAPDGSLSEQAHATRADGLALIGDEPALVIHPLGYHPGMRSMPTPHMMEGVRRVVLLSRSGHRRSVQVDLVGALDRVCTGGAPPPVRLFITSMDMSLWEGAVMPTLGEEERAVSGPDPGVVEIWPTDGSAACLARVGRREATTERGLAWMAATGSGEMRGLEVQSAARTMGIVCIKP